MRNPFRVASEWWRKRRNGFIEALDAPFVLRVALAVYLALLAWSFSG